MTDYKKTNNITGWIMFAIATIVYAITLEVTASYWDVGEFIAVSYKLQVPHPPGAPLFLLIGRLFSFLSMGNVESVAYWINMVSVVSSGLTIMFLFWTITQLGKKLMRVETGKETNSQKWTLMAAGVVGALAYTFTDSFWFSAVEAEVYAMSSFFTAFVFWAILKWEVIEDQSKANKWLIMIAYMIGLSIGVHFQDLVTLPALCLIYYFKKWSEHSFKGVVITLLVSVVILGIINNGVIPGLPSMAGSFEVFFVNKLGLPFGSGLIVFMILFIGAIVFGIYYSQKNDKELLNTALLSFAFIIIGYSSYAVIVIRSSYDPPIDENDPENIMSVVSYLKREQYGTWPLVHGQYFTAQYETVEQGDPVYVKGEEKYEISEYKTTYKYNSKETTILPRMWSSAHAQNYQDLMGLRKGEQPSFSQNLYYMFSHQIGHYYMRYFLWNFVGRYSDTQDAGILTPWDAFEDVPSAIANNEGRNNYFMIPFLLGIIGMLYNFRKDGKSFFVILVLFVMTGLALVVYLNSVPTQPRERDYIYAASFYTFAIWIGFSVIAFTRMLKEVISSNKVVIGISTALCLSAPAILAIENWDDHDRSDRYFSVDSAKNFLASCEPNAIIFTGGDNDTFPLWYVQEVEGFRTDVRVIVLSYANTDWYIEQMTRRAYESQPFPFTLTAKDYRQGWKNDVLIHQPVQGISGAINLPQYLKLLKEDHPALQYPTQSNSYHIVPSKEMYLDIDSAKVMSMGIIPRNKSHLLVDKMGWKIKGNLIEKKDLMILDLIATNNWERPLYFNNTSRQGIKLDLEDYMIQEGNAFRLLPIRNNNPNKQLVNTDIMYDNIMNKFGFRELDNPDVYYTEDYRNFVLNHRSSFNTLTGALLDEGKDLKAREVTMRNLEVMPDEGVPFDYSTASTVAYLFQVGETEKGKEIAAILGRRADEMLAYIIRSNKGLGLELQINMSILNTLARTLEDYGEVELAEELSNALDQHYGAVQQINSSPSRR